MAFDRPVLALWIDATPAASALQVFGMTLLERQLAALDELARDSARPLSFASVVVEHAPGAEPRVRPELARRLAVRFRAASGDLAARVARAAGEAAGAPLLLVAADAVVDTRLFAAVAGASGTCAALAGEGERATALLRIEPAARLAPSSAASLRDFARAQLAAGAAAPLALDSIAAHLVKLRRDLPVYAFALPGAGAVRETERFLFWSNYKGSTDFLTRWVFPPFVWASLGPLARWRVHPNWISALNVVLALGVMPLYADARWALALALSYLMAVLDSVDGKLARLTYRASRLGDVLDHGLDIVHPPFWYIAWAIGLSGGARGWIFQLSLFMLGIYVLDRLLAPLFLSKTGRSIHGHSRIDVVMRTWISRRNVNLPVFTLGLLVGAPVAAFVAIVAWQAFCLLFHAVRVAQVHRAGAAAP